MVVYTCSAMCEGCFNAGLVIVAPNAGCPQVMAALEPASQAACLLADSRSAISFPHWTYSTAYSVLYSMVPKFWQFGDMTQELFMTHKLISSAQVSRLPCLALWVLQKRDLKLIGKLVQSHCEVILQLRTSCSNPVLVVEWRTDCRALEAGCLSRPLWLGQIVVLMGTFWSARNLIMPTVPLLVM